MRVNIYAEEMTQRVELVKKGEFTGVRFYLELPVALATPPVKLGAQPGITHVSGPFMHHAGDDDSAAVTFWGKRDFRKAMIRALQLIDQAEAPASSEEIRAVSDKLNATAASAGRNTINSLVGVFGHYFKQGDDLCDAESVIRAIVQRTGGKISE